VENTRYARVFHSRQLSNYNLIPATSFLLYRREGDIVGFGAVLGRLVLVCGRTVSHNWSL